MTVNKSKSTELLRLKKQNAEMRKRLEKIENARPPLANYVKVNLSSRARTVCFYMNDGSKFEMDTCDESKSVMKALESLYAKTTRMESAGKN